MVPGGRKLCMELEAQSALGEIEKPGRWSPALGLDGSEEVKHEV